MKLLWKILIILLLLLIIGLLLYYFISGEGYNNSKSCGRGSANKKSSTKSKNKFTPGLNTNPKEYTHPKHIKQFITKDEAKLLMDLARPRLGPAQVRQYSTDSRYRKGKVAWLHDNLHPVIKKIKQKVSNVSGFPFENMEDLQVGYYDPGNFFKPHYDQCESNEKWCHATTYPRGGPRVYTFLMYLNDNFEGGYTNFTKLNKKFKLNPGDVIFFHNLDKKQEKVHSLSMHEGTELKSGEKWIATIWVREKKFR